MNNDTPSPGDAALEAQRRKSNVYAFRRLKWGEPKLRRSQGTLGTGRGQKRLLDMPGEKHSARLPDNHGQRPLHIALIVTALAAGALALVGAGVLATGQL